MPLRPAELRREHRARPGGHDTPTVPAAARSGAQSPCRRAGTHTAGTQARRRKCAPPGFFPAEKLLPRRYDSAMVKLLPFPLWEVLTNPAVARLSPTALGHLLLLLGTLWASGDMTLPKPQSAIQAACHAGDKAWARNREKLLTAYRALEPMLSTALAKGRHIMAGQQASAAHARAAKERKRLTQATAAERSNSFVPLSATVASPTPRRLAQPVRPSHGRGHIGGPRGFNPSLRD